MGAVRRETIARCGALPIHGELLNGPTRHVVPPQCVEKFEGIREMRRCINDAQNR